MSALLWADNVSFRYAAGAPLVVDGVTLRLDDGALAGILGPNGSGKTTLLRLLSGTRRPTSGRVLVRDQKRRWGSCSSDGSIRLNWRLVMLDPALIDYVVVHELAHLRVPNHSPRFWTEVERWIPDSRHRRRQLREAAKTLPL